MVKGSNVVWGDGLKSYNGSAAFTYDGIGNPLTYNNGSAYTFTWQNGRELASTVLKGVTSSYEYNADGLRTQKTVNGVVYDYYWHDGKLSAMTITNGSEVNELMFAYDSEGTAFAMSYNENVYYYLTDIQGNVNGLIDENGNIVAEYAYDVWGKPISATATTETHAKAMTANPIRYRGYIYDTETGFYYLQSRYYDPEIGRFVNADVMVDSETLRGFNLFAYCGNNPIMYVDPSGYKAIDITIKLTTTMCTNALYLYSLARLYRWAGLAGKLALLYKFYTLVKTGGKWDFKNQSAWKLKPEDYYTFMGVKLGVADIGNIHFGFVGSVLFSWRTLCSGAGLYQIYSGTSSWRFWYSFFDDPRDTLCISIGREMWKISFKKWVFQW